MQRRRTRAMTPAAALALLLMPTAAAVEVIVQNDSLGDGDSGLIQAGFDPGESAAAWLTAPCDGDIVAVQILWLSLLGGEPQSVEDSITIFAAGSFPFPGAALEVLEAPVMTDGYLNEFRYLDEEQQIPLTVPVQEGQTFLVSFKFANDPDPFNGPSVVTDIDGCQDGKNGLFANGIGWTNSCDWGVSGDWVIRAVIDCGSVDMGACCIDTMCFDDLNEEDCIDLGGTWQGADTTCDVVDCDPEGACCIPATEGCLDLTEGNCAIVDGLWQGPDTDCETFICFPKGACCLPDASCEDEMSPEECEDASGLFMGHETTCDTVECPEPEGACCLTMPMRTAPPTPAKTTAPRISMATAMSTPPICSICSARGERLMATWTATATRTPPISWRYSPRGATARSKRQKLEKSKSQNSGTAMARTRAVVA
jgi:hypothetical protein